MIGLSRRNTEDTSLKTHEPDGVGMNDVWATSELGIEV